MAQTSIEEELKKIKDDCPKIKEFLQKYEIWDPLIDSIQFYGKEKAEKICLKIKKKNFCTLIFSVLKTCGYI